MSHRALATPVAGRAQCTLTWCFLLHIGAAGFQVKWALCQEAVRLGWVSEDARLSTFASPESIRELQRRDKTVTTNWIP